MAFDKEGRYTLLVAASLIHELGHVICMVVCGKRIEAVTIVPGGFDIRYSGGHDSYWADIAITLCGPGANLAVSVAFLGIQSRMTDYFIGINLVLCLFNMLPVYPLDGGRALHLVMECLLGPDRAWSAFSFVSIAVSFAMSASAMYFFVPGKSLWPIVVFGFVLYTQRIFLPQIWKGTIMGRASVKNRA